jgi:hypothetical protein
MENMKAVRMHNNGGPELLASKMHRALHRALVNC